MVCFLCSFTLFYIFAHMLQLSAQLSYKSGRSAKGKSEMIPIGEIKCLDLHNIGGVSQNQPVSEACAMSGLFCYVSEIE